MRADAAMVRVSIARSQQSADTIVYSRSHCGVNAQRCSLPVTGSGRHSMLPIQDVDRHLKQSSTYLFPLEIFYDAFSASKHLPAYQEL